MTMSLNEGLALVLVAFALLQARAALKAAATSESSMQSERFLNALATALFAVFLLMPRLSVGWWLAFAAMLGTSVAGLRLFIRRPRQSKVSRGAS